MCTYQCMHLQLYCMCQYGDMNLGIFLELQTFERCVRFLRKRKESDRWNSISPEMMSDEEKRGSVYVRHQPEYRSETFNLFMKKLDE